MAFVGDIYEDLELWYPKLRLIEAGASFVIAGEEAATVYSGKNGYPCKSDIRIDDAKSTDFDAVLLPGGFMPDRLRRLPNVKRLIAEFSDQKSVWPRFATAAGSRFQLVSIPEFESQAPLESKTTWSTLEPFGKTLLLLSTVILLAVANQTTCHGSRTPSSKS